MARVLTTTALAKKDAAVIEADWLLEAPALGIALSYSFAATGIQVAVEWEYFAPAPIGTHWGLAFAGVLTQIGPDVWEHRLMGLNEVEFSVPPGGGVGAVGSLEARIVEDGTGMSLRSTWNRVEQLEGAQVSLSLLFTGEAYVDKIPIFTGEIDQASWSNGEGTLQAVDDTLPADVLLPQTLVTRDSFVNAPEQSINQALPLLYGAGREGRLELAPLLLVDGLTLVRYRLAGHALGRLGTQYGVWPPGARQVRTATALSVDIGPAEIVLAESIVATIFHDAGAPLSLSREQDVTNASQALDGDPETLAIIGTDQFTHTNGDGHGYLGVQVGLVNPEGVNIVEVDLRNYRRSATSTPTMHANVFLRLIDANLTVIRDNLWASPTFRHTSSPHSDLFTVKPISIDSVHSLEALLDVRNEGGFGTAEDTYEVGSMLLDVGYQPDSALEQVYVDGSSAGLGHMPVDWERYAPPPIGIHWGLAFADVEGPEESAGFSGRVDESGAITGTPGAVIENPADVIRSIFVDELGKRVDTTSFNDARALYGTDVFDGGIGAGWSTDRLTARQALDDLASQAHAYIVPTGSGAFRLVPYAADTPPVFDFTQDHVLVTNPDQPASERTSSLRIALSSMDLVANTFRVRYAWHPGLRQYAKACYATPSGSNHPSLAADLTAKCSDSAQRYGLRPPREIDAYWISDPATAEALLVHEVEYRWTQQIIATFVTTLCAIHLEPADLVTFTHPELPTLVNGNTFEVIRAGGASPSEGTIALTLMRSGQLSFTYFAIQDQDEQVYFWWVSSDGTLSWDITPPTSGPRLGIDLLITPIPSWLEISDSGGFPWFVYPTLQGEPTVEIAAPPLGAGYIGSPQVRGQPPGTWEIQPTPQGEIDIVPSA